MAPQKAKKNTETIVAMGRKDARAVIGSVKGGSGAVATALTRRVAFALEQCGTGADELGQNYIRGVIAAAIQYGKRHADPPKSNGTGGAFYLTKEQMARIEAGRKKGAETRARKSQARRDKIHEILRERGPLGTGDVAKAAGMSTEGARLCLRKLEEEGRVGHHGNGSTPWSWYAAGQEPGKHPGRPSSVADFVARLFGR